MSAIRVTIHSSGTGVDSLSGKEAEGITVATVKRPDGSLANQLYLADFRKGRVQIYDASFHHVSLGDDAFEPGARAVVALVIRAVHKDFAHLLGDVLVRLRVRDAEIPRESTEHARVVDVHPLAVLPPGLDRPAFE